MHKVIKESLL